MLDKITIADFQPYLNHEFEIRFTPEHSHTSRLMLITPWGSPDDASRQPFTLEFETEMKDQYYLQGVFTLVHPGLGELPLFMVPVGLGNQGMRYEIVIS